MAVATNVGVPVAVGRGVIVVIAVAVSIGIRAVAAIEGAEVGVFVCGVETVAVSSAWDELFARKDGVANGRVTTTDVLSSAPEIGRQATNANITRDTYNCCM